MDSKDFIKLLANPKEVEKLPVDELKKLSMEYPYSQPVQLLYTIRLSQSSEYLFNRQLGKTSILTDDRTVLFDLFERDMEEAGTTTVLPTSAEKEPAIVKTSDPEPEENKITAIAEPVEESAEEIKPVINRESPEPAKADHPPVEEKSKEEEKKITPPVEKEPEKKPLDLSGLSPKEKVQAILEENKRIRQQFDAKKSGEPQAEVHEKPEEVIVGREVPQEELPKPAEEEVTEENTESTVAVEQDSIKEEDEVSQFKEPIDSPAEFANVAEGEPAVEDEELFEPMKLETAPQDEPETHEEKEALVFTIDEDRPEPVFEIESDEEDYKPEVAKDVDTGQTVENDIKEEYQKPAVSLGKERSEAHSFAEWLHILQSSRKVETTASKEEKSENPGEPVLPVKKKIELLDSFVEKLPELKRKNIAAPRLDKPEINMGNLMGGEEDSLVTETLARVYMRQKHYEKAIKAYEIMKLKYPEKSSFFADQISEIRKLINSK